MKYVCSICFEIYGESGICGLCNSEAMQFDVIELDEFLSMNEISVFKELLENYKKDTKLRKWYKEKVIKNIEYLITLKEKK